ncbi:aminoglycoside N(3)-acetyltransferase [Microbacterium bovistercoris]|uniref:Aminoglycoside N(3)-acetyltransferase n=1 Tax=Microbacterium bovistercoris TaxID=2293570 RepID=A0A371NPL9_9MICO|nr:AAC(3) family N-acetyltransferase [Microbacterium bovistercoris]REJ04144.1 aminoglycoside N(3)-acetyltransferase [Microbacterium bovistercoris]
MKNLAETDSPFTPTLVTGADLRTGLAALGVEPGQVLLVHASLSSFGVVAGGEQTVITALRETVGPFGTVVMPSQSWQLCDPDYLDDPALPSAARSKVRQSLPVFDEVLTPTRSMGAIAELFRLQPDAHRSPHPHRSFAAAGLEAREITRVHELSSPFGESSPLARLYALDAVVVLLGVGFDKCTSLHLAEHRAAEGGARALVRNGAALAVSGARQWVSWEEPVVDDAEFVSIGRAFDSAGNVRTTKVGAAVCRAMSMVELVDFAAQQMKILQGT